MKQSGVMRIIIIAANLVLAFVCFVAYIREDKVKPEFMFQTSDYIYTESAQTDTLLQNITAYDDRDGDITERIVVEKVTENRASSIVVVYYAVSDSAGNVAKISRAFRAVFDEQEYEEAVQTLAGAGTLNVEKLENRAAEDDSWKDVREETDMGNSGQTEENENAGENDEAGDRASEDEVGEKASEDEAGVNQAVTKESENGRQVTADETENSQDEAGGGAENAPEPEAQAGSGVPVLTMKKQEVTIEAGTTPPWTEIIETLRDDKDDYATLYYNLNISRFNRSQEGDYPVTLYTEDSDGNKSETVTVMVHVKENG